MFKRLILEQWHIILVLIAFFLTFGSWLVLTIRTILMRKSDREHMAGLPLEEEQHIICKRHE